MDSDYEGIDNDHPLVDDEVGGDLDHFHDLHGDDTLSGGGDHRGDAFGADHDEDDQLGADRGQARGAGSGDDGETDWLSLLPGFEDLAGDGDLGFEPVDPNELVLDPAADSVAGEPEADTAFWLYQGEGNGTCAPTSVAMVIADIVGQPLVTNDAVVERALELGLIEYDPSKAGVDAWSGMTDQGIMMLCESFGLDVSLSYGDIGHLADALESGRTVMVALDADEIWYDAQDDTLGDDSGFDANHEVVVTGVDVDAGVVYLNDPGAPDGFGTAIPLAQFEDAWGDSANAMIVTDFTEEVAAERLDLTPIADGGGRMPGFDDIADFGITPAADLPDHPRDPGFSALDRGDESGIGQTPGGLAGLILLPFTFVVHLVDEIS